MPNRLLYTIAFCISLSGLAQQPGASNPRYCASCGISGVDTIVSQSGQFVVHGPPQRAIPPARRENEPPLIEAEPQLVAVTAERLKRAFLDDLGIADTFHDKVHILILARARPEQPIGLISNIHPDGFQYSMGIPAYLETHRLIKGLAQVLLQEYANRGAHRNAELPSWLVEGINRQLLSSVVPAPVVNRKPLTVERIGYDRLRGTRSFFQTNSPLTIQELSFNNLNTLSAFERDRYESSAHFLVYELYQLRGGSALMNRFLKNLPYALNWQTAFYSAYGQYFHTPLDLEKWWMLRCVEIKNRQARQNWSTAVSLDRLESTLKTPAEFHASTNALPQRRDATLQQVLSSVDFGVQKEILGQKLQQIFFLSANFSPEVEPLGNAYEQAIQTYLEKRALSDYQPTLKSDPEQRLQLLVKSALKTFDELDRAREEVRAGRTPNLTQSARRSSGRQVLVTRGSFQK